MESLWQGTAQRREFAALDGDKKCDVLIIGGGLAGLLCARALTDAGAQCVLIESGRICSGTTKNTTAKITLQHGLIYDKLIRKYGVNFARGYLEANKEALSAYKRLCVKVECDYKECEAAVYTVRDMRRIERELVAYDRLAYFADFVGELPIPVDILGGVRVRGQAQFNPLKLAFGISEGLEIYENTKAVELAPGICRTDRGTLRAEKIVVATHFPILNKHGLYFIKQYQHRSYVLALEGVSDIGGMYIDEDKLGMSFRSYGDTLLLGGGSHRTGKRGGGYRELEEFAEKHYTGARIAYRFAAQDCMTLDGVPYIGHYSSALSDVYVATGFNKWGMTSSMIGARLISDLILGRNNPYAEVFSPSRRVLHPQLLVNIGESLVGLVTPKVPRCPHLGCALKYNRQEHSWDCSCHGSRFSESGELLEGPSTDGLKK